ncbi:MAG: UDP-N-acetylglucosamine 2-epimerase [Promethearchaeota archaeon]
MATIHRAENTDDPKKLENIFTAFGKLASSVCPLLVPTHPQTRKQLEKLSIISGINKHVLTIEAVSYLDMITLEKNAKVIFTDSGGVQKEAYFAHVPGLTLRNETEWTETLSGGWNRFTGAETKKIMEGFNSACENQQETFESYFGDGHSGEKILDILRSQT